jgi:hypothetical protein
MNFWKLVMKSLDAILEKTELIKTLINAFGYQAKLFADFFCLVCCCLSDLSTFVLGIFLRFCVTVGSSCE